MKKTIAILICAASFHLMAGAQTAYTLDQCKQLAKENNHTLSTAYSHLKQSEEQAKQAYTSFFPQVQAFGLGMQSNKHLVEMDLDLPAEMAAMLPPGITLPSSMGMMKKGVLGSISAIQPVFTGGKITIGNKLAKLGVEANRIQIESSEDEVELTTEQYFWSVVSFKEKLRTLQSLQAMLAQLEKDVSVAVKAGVTMRNDLLQVQLKENEVESGMLQVNNAISIYSQLLAQYIGASGNIDVVSNIDTESVPPLDLSVRRDHTAALAATPQYRLLEKNVESHQLMHNMKKGENLPTVGVGAAYSYNDFMDKGRGVGTLFATVSVPISGWWGGTHAVRKQRLALDDAKSQLQDNSEKLIINMNNAWANVETSHKQLQIARKSIEQSEENLRLNNDFYKAGTTKLSDLLDAQSSYQQARDKFVDAYINYQTNLLKYRQATGQ